MSKNDVSERLERLNRLLAEGLITQAEYDAKKNSILPKVTVQPQIRCPPRNVRRFVAAALIVAVLVSGALFGLLVFNQKSPLGVSSAIRVPTGTVHYTNITLTNSQSIPTPAPFQQMISIDSSSYSAYEASNLGNVEFFYADGTVIPSWLESGNSNTATSTIYWLKLSQSIPAGGSTTVYMGFVATTTRLLNGLVVGESPQLTPVYGQYDNGARVFDFYDDFAGTRLSSQWSFASQGVPGSASRITINNGLNLASDPVAYTSATWIASTSTSAQFTRDLVADFEVAANVDTRLGFEDTLPHNWCLGNGAGFEIGTSTPYIDTVRGGTNVVCQFGTAVTATYSSGFPTATRLNVYSVQLSPSDATFLANYSGLDPTSITTTVPQFSSNIGVFIMTNGFTSSGNVAATWVRTRASPPNAVMPTATVRRGATQTPTIIGSQVNPNTNSVTLPAGGLTYIYAATEGGSFDINAPSFTQDLSVVNNGGLHSILIGHSTSNVGSYNPNGALFPIIGGIGASASYSTSLSFHNAGTTSLSGSFTLPSSALVVLASASSNNQPFLSVSSSFTVDSSGSTCCGTVAFAHASLAAGSYSVTIDFAACASSCTSDPLAMAVGVVLYVFPASNTGWQ